MPSLKTINSTKIIYNYCFWFTFCPIFAQNLLKNLIEAEETLKDISCKCLCFSLLWSLLYRLFNGFLNLNTVSYNLEEAHREKYVGNIWNFLYQKKLIVKCVSNSDGLSPCQHLKGRQLSLTLFESWVCCLLEIWVNKWLHYIQWVQWLSLSSLLISSPVLLI